VQPLRRQAGQPRFEPQDRLLLAALSRKLPRRSWNAFLVRPETLPRWHRRLVARLYLSAPKAMSTTKDTTSDLVANGTLVRFAREP
jgi:hypothetical protein